MSTVTLPPAVDPEPGWGQSLAAGAPGIALWHIERARAGLGPWSAAHQWAAATTREPISTHPGASLYTGAPAVAFALHTADQDAYHSALHALDAHIRRIAVHRLAAAHTRIDRRQLPALAEFDLISGLTGLGAYLHHRATDRDTLSAVLTYLVRLTRSLTVAGQQYPGWWTGNGPQDRPSPDWDGGHANLGMAHGIAGPLALLSTTMRHGITVAGHSDAIHRICTWLDIWRCGPRSQPWWPSTISEAHRRSEQPTDPRPHRPSWCYGTPGLARAMQLAGLALDDRQRQLLAEDALAACIADDRQTEHLTDASLCHGWAGLALTVWRVAAEAHHPQRLTAYLPRLVARLERHLAGQPTASDGLLDGTAGIRLARHTTARPTPPSRWDACLLTAG